MIKKNNEGTLAKDKIDVSLISQPSDLFGKESVYLKVNTEN